MNKMGAALHITNEGSASWSRTTKYGRKITYTMTVTQHPSQARACGLGSKSNTDRRPVDPPPILDLHVYEGEGNAMQDITFSYKANFFVWASLEFGRPIAPGRASQSPANTPVLCGTPVAGISYLDRPDPAGYFIFPDLSVRHEGNYRINFTLYEDLKDRDYEDDSLSHMPLDTGGLAECVNCRCEVRSVPFTVFSAKKFPGLQESTSLSRIVAEQGCRVRIRRDVRMRKRDPKHSRDWDDYEDETAEQRFEQLHDQRLDQRGIPESPPNSTPAPPNARRPSDHTIGSRNQIRSNSANSVTSPHIKQSPKSQQLPEWMSQDTGRSYSGLNHSTQHVPSPAAPTYFHHSHRSSQEPQPLSTYGPATFIPDQHMAQSPQNMTNPQMTSLGMQVATHSPWSYGTQSHQIQSPVYGPPVNHIRQNSMQYPPPDPPEYQHPPTMSSQYDANLAQNPPSYAMPESDTYGRQTHSHSSYSNERPTAMTSQISAPYGMELPPLRHQASQPSFDRPQGNEYSLQYSQPGNFVPPAVPPEYMSQPNGPTAQKRSYGSVFNTQPMEGPLRSGARPDAFPNVPYTIPDAHGSSDDDDAQESDINGTMQYRRADGTVVDRRWPITN